VAERLTTSAEQTAAAQLERLLYILPAAAQEGGEDPAQLALDLGVEPVQVFRDLEEVTARVYYHPSGGADDLQISIELDCVQVRTTGEFRRPPKLSQREALALSLALRAAAAEADEGRQERLIRFAKELEAGLSWASSEDLLPRFALSDYESGAGELRGLLLDAALAGRRCRIRYLAPSEDAPSNREIDPYVIVHAGGHWYALGHCHAREDIRAFRLDRMLEAAQLSDLFEPQVDFDPADHIEGGRVYRSDDGQEVTIRYAPVVAPWLVERGWGAPGADGSLEATHHAADPSWAVRHVLQYGAEAEILKPPEYRLLVKETAERLVN
jgi:proteasome accessory factor C